MSAFDSSDSSEQERSLHGEVLWLIPTEYERCKLIETWQQNCSDVPQPEFHVCGFGVIAAGVVTTRLIASHRPRHVVLLGIGGSYDLDRAPLGSVATIGRVYSDAVGAERRGGLGFGELKGASFGGSGWELPSELGFPQIPASVGLVREPASLVPTMLESDQSIELGGANYGLSLLTVGIASGTLETTRQRQHRFPSVVVEDMEGYAVAVACCLAGIPLTIFRGITNEVGDRQTANWQIRAAMENLVCAVREAGSTRSPGRDFA